VPNYDRGARRLKIPSAVGPHSIINPQRVALKAGVEKTNGFFFKLEIWFFGFFLVFLWFFVVFGFLGSSLESQK